MYENIYLPVQGLPKIYRINTGGMCGIQFFKVEDVLVWPAMDPRNGVINDPVQLKPGGTFYPAQLAEKDRLFKEIPKSTAAGPHFEMTIDGRIMGNSIAHSLSMNSMKHHQFGLILHDRNGEQRLVGNADAGASFSYGYDSGDIASSRVRTLQWQWKHQHECPYYLGGSVSAPVGTGSGGSTVEYPLTFVDRFKVGTTGMVNLQTVYSNSLLVNKRVMVFSSGQLLSQVPDPVTRYIIKNLPDAFITFVGGVRTGEIIEIYAF